MNVARRSRPRLRLVTAPWSSLYDLPVEAVVEEQDRYRLLGLDDVIPPPVHESWPRLVSAIDQQRPAPLGSLLNGGGRPLRLRAVLIDIDRGAEISPVHLREVAERLCQMIDALGIRRLGMPLLGAVHGHVPPGEFAAIFAPRLATTALETFYLLAGSNPGAVVLNELRAAFDPEPG